MTTFDMQLVGSWSLISNINVRPDGTRVNAYGPSPKGLLMFDASGHFSVVILDSDIPKFSDNSRTGTPEQNEAVVSGSIAAFGSYSVEEVDQIKTIILHVEGCTYPNWIGNKKERRFTLMGDEQKWIVADPSKGGLLSEVVWKRVK